MTGGIFPGEVITKLETGGFRVELAPGDLSEDEVIDALQGAWGYLLGGSERITRHAWPKLPELRFACFLGTGYSTFMEVPESRSNISFTYTPHANAAAVAEFTIAHMLDLVRGVTRRALTVRAGQWMEDATRSVIGARIGIAGMGHVGQEVARIAKAAFGMEVLYWNRTSRSEFDDLPYTAVPTVTDLCEAADIVSVHFDYEPGKNDGVIGAEELSALGADGYLVNTARAALVDPDALRKALEQDWIAGASIDGYFIEPTPSVENDPYGLLQFAPHRLLITPHCAYLSTQAVRKMAAMATESMLAVARGDTPPYAID